MNSLKDNDAEKLNDSESQHEAKQGNTHSREESILETEHSTVENDTSTYDKKAYVTCSEYHKTEAENDSKSVLSPSKPANKFPDVISKCSERQESPVEKIEKVHASISIQGAQVEKDILCIPCADDDLEVKATHFCKTCEDPEPLCESCAKQHTRQKIAKNHEISADMATFLTPQKVSRSELLCIPCSDDNLDVKATHFCNSCEDPDPLCESCAKQHIRQKIAKDHEICSDMTKFPTVQPNTSQKTLCIPCLDDSLDVKATHFCKTCEDPEPLCESCAKQHTRQKITKNHEICSDIAKFSPTQTDDRRDIQIKKETLCIPCLDDSLDVKATHFCKTCEDPEPLCESCAKQHTRQKIAKNHEICSDIAMFTTTQTNDRRDIQIKKETLCIPCLDDSLDVKATHFCKTCGDPEPLCESCAKQHTRQKITKNHEICSDIAMFTTTQTNDREKTENENKMFCIPCLNDKLDVKATHFCKTCEDPEPLCESCANQHTRQKFARDHDVCANMTEFSSTQPKNGENMQTRNKIACIPCSYDKLDVKATHFCQTCEDPEPLCESCAKQHIRQKVAYNHKICEGMTDFCKNQLPTGKNENQIEILCNPCFNDTIKVKATYYCKTCKDPEPFCDLCAKQHTRQKIFREHKLCGDMRDFTEQKNDVKSKEETETFCGPCLYDDTKIIAMNFCKTCQDPEPFCDTCAKKHTREKLFREHAICRDIQVISQHSKNTRSSEVDVKENPIREEINTFSTPGIPTILKIVSDTVDLFWSKSEGKVDYYQIRYKSLTGEEKWKSVATDADQSEISISGLMANTKYVFQVRGVYQDQEGRYGPANENIQTPESLATHLLDFSKCVDKGDPSKHQLLATELKESRNELAKTKKLILGDDRIKGKDEKTIMLVGATGSGKSTLVDGIVNYVMGVSFDDPFRFTLVQLEEEEKRTHNQAVSQTEWITVYKIAPQQGSRLDYTLNIIDTPGFGDTRGLERDQCTVNQIRHLFSEEGAKGVLYIDAVCFIVKAPDARLTASQKYIFSSIMALFGKDIKSNICTLVTFADGAEPPVLASLTEAKLPFGSTFQFNNSALFAANKNLTSTSLSPIFWEMGCKSFQEFFDKICNFETRSLALTKDVLKEREQLKQVITSIFPQVKAGLSKLSELRNQLEVFQRNRADIENNKDFEYEVDEVKQVKVELKPGQHVTNCLHCNITCHENCAYADDDQKRNCCVMTNDYCTVCTKKCIWSDHKNTRYIFRYNTEKVKKTYTEMKKKYEKAKGSKMTHQAFIEGLTRDVENLFDCVKRRMGEMKRCKSRLEIIALRPDPLSTVEHLDLMIQAEEMEKHPGFEQRIKMLNEFRHMALIEKDVDNFDEGFQSTKEKMASYGIASNKKEGNVIERGIDFIKDFFSH